MLFSEEQLNEIEEMAALFFSPESIALNIECDSDDFTELIQNKIGDAFKAYCSGRLRSEIELRTAIRNAAMNGSTPAQTLFVTYYKDSIL
jgi:hypothetical protein